MHRGLLADWGYTVPLDTSQAQAKPLCTPQLTPPTPPCDLPPTSPVSQPSNQPSEMGDNFITIHISIPSQEDRFVRIGLSQLQADHDIVLSMERDHPSDQSQPSIDTNPPLSYCRFFPSQDDKGHADKSPLGDMVVDGCRTCDGWPWKTGHPYS